MYWYNNGTDTGDRGSPDWRWLHRESPFEAQGNVAGATRGLRFARRHGPGVGPAISQGVPALDSPAGGGQDGWIIDGRKDPSSRFRRSTQTEQAICQSRPDNPSRRAGGIYG